MFIPKYPVFMDNLTNMYKKGPFRSTATMASIIYAAQGPDVKSVHASSMPPHRAQWSSHEDDD